MTLFSGALQNVDSITQLANEIDLQLDKLTSEQAMLPFEAELAYLLLRFNKVEDGALKLRSFIRNNYPEKLMMLDVIDGWLDKNHLPYFEKT